MITLIHKIRDIFYSNKPKHFPLDLEIDQEYFLKSYVEIEKEEALDFSECFIEIINLPDPEHANELQEEILEHKFFKETKIKFKCENITPTDGRFCIADLFYSFPYFTGKAGNVINIELFQINNKTIERLNTNLERKEQLFNIIYRYLDEDFEGTITEIGIFAEYIAFKIARKINRALRNFKSAVNTLCSLKISKMKKINYNYIGALLWPLYYIRNQKLHAFSEIETDQFITKTAFNILSEIIRYLSKNDIKF